MDEVPLDGRDWWIADDFYSALLPALGAPPFHGRNLDVLWDSITCDDINSRKLPYRIVVFGIERMSPECKELVRRFENLIHQAREAGPRIELVLRS